MSEQTTSIVSPPPSNENTPSEDSLLILDFQASPLEELLERDLTTMPIEQLREHLMRLREVATQPVKRKQLLQDESDAIKTRRPPKKRVAITDDMY